MVSQVVAPSPQAGQGQPIRQFSRLGVIGVWLAAAVPMALLGWVVAPAVAGEAATSQRWATTLIFVYIGGLAWQFVMVLIVVGREQRTLRWAAVRRALWLARPRDASGRPRGRLWWWLVPFILGVAVLDLVPVGITGPENRDLGAFLDSSAGQDTFHGAWGLLGVVAVMLVLNTVLGEELLFRGVLLPRMRGVFGRADWLVNGLLFGLYHLNQPWVIPNAVLAGWLLAYPTRRFRSAWFGIAIHSAESVFIFAVILGLVLS